MKRGSGAPADLDRVAKAKFVELLDMVDQDIDRELIANYARQYGTLVAIRTEKARQIKTRTFDMMVKGRDGTKVMNPLIVSETRLVASLNRSMRALGLSPGREEQDRRRCKSRPSIPPPPGCSGREPPGGWVLEIALCRGMPDPTPEDVAREKAWDEWLEANGHRDQIRK